MCDMNWNDGLNISGRTEKKCLHVHPPVIYTQTLFNPEVPLFQPLPALPACLQQKTQTKVSS